MQPTRTVAAVAVVLAVVLAGCGQPVGCSSRGLMISVYPVDDPPPNATVTDSTQVQNVNFNETTLRELLTRVVETGPQTYIDVTGQEICRVKDTFADVPRYDGDQSGYYLRHDGAVVRVVLISNT